MKMMSTKDFSLQKVKLLVYGTAGSGKTYLIRTLPKPIVLSAEAGLLSLAGHDISYIEIADLESLRKAYLWLTSEEANVYETVCLDSISEIAEVVLTNEKKHSKDPRQAYGAMQEQVTDLIRAFRDLPNKHVYFSAKIEKTQNETGRLLFSPSMPGNKVGQQLPYFFDEVLALRVEKDSEGKIVRVLQCEGDGVWTAKDRSGKLGMWESPDLGDIIKKITTKGENHEDK